MSTKETQKGKTLVEIVKGKNYPFIEFRCRYQLKDGTKCDDFFGWASYIDGKLKPLDCESYSLKVFLIFLGIAKLCQEPWFDGAAH